MSHRFKISGHENFLDVILTSDHPSLPEARFAVSAEILSEENDLKKSILFSLVTPIPNFEKLSGKLLIPNPKVALVVPFRTDAAVELVLPNELGTHKVSLELDIQGSKVLKQTKVINGTNLQ